MTAPPKTRSAARFVTITMAVTAAGLACPAAQAAPVQAPPQIAPVAAGGSVGTIQVRPRRAVGVNRIGLAATPGEGSFVERSDGRIFRIVGGAPLFVSTWTAFGAKMPVTRISDATYNSLRFWPRDGTFVKSGQDRRIYRFVGGAPVYVSTWAAYGGTVQPTMVVDKADIDHAGVETDPWFGVNKTVIDYPFMVSKDGLLTATSLDGTLFVRGGQTGRIYKMVGGAPQYVSTWTIFGGARPTIALDQIAIDRAGGTAQYRFLRSAPLDQWLVKSVQDARAYVIAGGAPLYIATPAVLSTISDGLAPARLDKAAIDHGGDPAPWDHLRYVPADHTFIAGLPSHRVSQVIDGVPHRVLSWNDVGGPKPFTFVDDAAIDKISNTAPWDHLHRPG